MLARLARGLFISTKTTPNPNFLKFLPNKPIMGGEGTMDFPSIRYTHVSPMARELFKIPGVNRVFYGPDYVSISKEEKTDWAIIKPAVFDVITRFVTGVEPLLTDKEEPADTAVSQGDSEAVQLIKEIISTRIRPVIQ
jgi:hypothetical protein